MALLTFRLYGYDVTGKDYITNALRLQVQLIFSLLPVAAIENSSQISNIYSAVYNNII